MSNEKRAWAYDLLFILVLFLAGILRFTGVQWGEGQHQHPDELFLTGVLNSLRARTCEDPLLPVDACPEEQKRWITLGEYLDADTSPLNPYNRGYGFFVYGNLPMTLTRFAMELSGNDELGRSKFFARQMSALADMFTIFLLYLIVSKLYGRRVGLFASAFSALAVMQIQQSHFFTADLFVNLFMFLALLFAVWILTWRREETRQERSEGDESPSVPSPPPLIVQFFKDPFFYLSIGFGVALGMAMASKINAAAMAVVLPFAFFARWLIHDRRRKLHTDDWMLIVAFLIAGGLAAFVSFRIFQPYAFDGLWLNEQWVRNISEQRAQATGKADLPWNLQWARRSHLYSFENLTLWGLGLPLGILAWTGFLFMGWRILKGEYKHLLLWGWTAFYFLWQSLQFNPTMRYQLPIYPLLCMMAAWVLFEIPKLATDRKPLTAVHRLSSAVAFSLGTIVLALTAAWAFAFHSIYLRDEPRIAASRWLFQNAPGPVNLRIRTTDAETYNQPLPMPYEHLIREGEPYTLAFAPLREGMLYEVMFGYVRSETGGPLPVFLTVSSASDPDQTLARAAAILDPSRTNDPRGPSLTLTLDTPVRLTTNERYLLRIETMDGAVSLSGSGIANETDYDFGLPFRVDGYDPYGGIYAGELVLQVYWNDDAAKLERFVDILSRADYIVIPTNHQYAQITRLPERYPLTTLYYRELLGCPPGENIIHCYYQAKPGMYGGRLGFQLVQVFESYPSLGPFVVNDSYAEEAFTFYDHPKVLIFQKTDDFDTERVRAILKTVDLTKVVNLKPTEFDDYKTLMLPEDRLARQRAGGTWSELFRYEWLHNKYPLVGLLLWYAFLFVLGLTAYPLARLALPGLQRYAYPLGRIAGLALLAWLAWIGGSLGVPYTRESIGAAFVLIAAAGFGLWMKRKDQFRAEWNAERRFFVSVEVVFLVFFLLDLLIRLGNSDMWHPAKGGERPMDFSYFNAVLKSTSFPPYDPWYAGGYINYYYYGFVLAGTPVKLLGIVPSIAYNFILPTWFALVAIGAFTLGFALVENQRSQVTDDRPSNLDFQLHSGLAAASLTVLLGNLGTIQLIFRSLQRIAAPEGNVPAEANLLQRWGWALQGVWKMLTEGANLPIGRGDWYWHPSRVIPHGPGNEITEFPFFTFLYSDLHAHMLVMPLALFIIAWALSFVRARAQLTRAEWIAAFAAGGLMIGALKPTNTWDLYTYYLLAAIAAGYTILRYFEWKDYLSLPAWTGKMGLAVGAAAGLYALSAIFYLPFSHWFGQAYNAVELWSASRTPLSSYFTQWGLFLFLITAWLAWETREWMAATPVSHLSRLRRYARWMQIALAAFLAVFVFLLFDGVRVALVALPLAVWSAALLLRPDLPDAKRFTLFLIGTALAITIVVELVALVGDIGRMNTIFKLYLQAWMLFAVAAAASFGWLLKVVPAWNLKWRTFYQTGASLLAAGAFLFTLTASADKISDRMAPSAPHTLDSMTFMKYAELWDGQVMDLSQDYRAIRWMQDHIEGSPVIVEANCSEYRWCTRFTIYTGLPGVVGWNWHQRQQRGMFASQVQERVNEVNEFYRTNDVGDALDFLKKYGVRYIVVGQLERNVYPPLPDLPDGLEKFARYEGVHWRAVYRDADTTIYEVLP